MSETPLPQRAGFTGMLEDLVRLIEHQSPAMRCSILLLDEDGVTLRHGAAPSLPAHYSQAIDGLHIGPGMGSCGTAAFTRATTIVEDIATHVYWADFRDLALSAGLRACWSTPIFGTTGEVLGTFAMYYDEPRAPTESDLALIGTAAVLASALVERERLLATSEADRHALSEANATLEEQQVELELANQQLQESSAELEALNFQLQDNAAELEMQTTALETANRAKSEFLAAMSHELRTPLNAVTGYADLLLAGVRGGLSDSQRADLERIKRSGQHLLGLINDILNFAKLESGRVEFNVDDTPVVTLLESLEELVRPQVDGKALSYAQHAPPENLLVRADAEKVRQILLNLVTNAVKFTEPGGRIAVECEGDERHVCIVVRDTGRGIAQEHLSRIFDPFVQIDRELTPKSQQGVGLGLSISRDLAQGMGGTLTATSTVGQGSAFTLTLPRAVRMPDVEPLTVQSIADPPIADAAAQALLAQTILGEQGTATRLAPPS
jgi:signal transduction histidine kinase